MINFLTVQRCVQGIDNTTFLEAENNPLWKVEGFGEKYSIEACYMLIKMIGRFRKFLV